MSSKFSQVRNKRVKPPHCKPAPGIPVPDPDANPIHLYCNLKHDLTVLGEEEKRHFAVPQYPTPPDHDYEWGRSFWRNAMVQMFFTVYLDIHPDRLFFDLYCHIHTIPYYNYQQSDWLYRAFDRHYPICTPTLYETAIHATGISKVWIFVRDIGKPHPPP